MTTRQKIELRLSEVRWRLNEIAGIEGEARTEEIGAEQGVLTTEFGELEVRFQAATLADPATEITDDDAEGRELRAMTDEANIGAIYTAAIEHRQTAGREQEIQKHFKLGPNQVPLSMLRTEVRTSGSTAAPSSVGTSQAAIIPAVFPQSVAAFLSIPQPTVGVGDATFPVLSTSAAVRTPAEGSEAATSEGVISAELLTPSRLQASMFFSREDQARFMGMDPALRMNLSDALADQLDKEAISGTNGLLTGTNLSNNNVSAETSYALYRSGLLFSRVDGKYAGKPGDIRLVLGSATLAHAASQYRSTNSDSSAYDLLERDSGGVRVSAHVPAVASHKQNVLVRLGSRMDMVQAVWDGITIVVDEISQLDEGEIKLSGIMLQATKILRTGGFSKRQTQHA